jgi:Transposase
MNRKPDAERRGVDRGDLQHARDREAARAEGGQGGGLEPAEDAGDREAKVKTDTVDAEVLAQLLAADYLPAVWLPDDETHALRRQVARRAHIVRQRTRLKNQVQSILHRNLVPRCPAADLFGRNGSAWLSEQELPADARARSFRSPSDSTSWSTRRVETLHTYACWTTASSARCERRRGSRNDGE